MKLSKVHVTEFQSLQDSNEFEVGDVTCLVGKNEAGKTALLQALYRLNEDQRLFPARQENPEAAIRRSDMGPRLFLCVSGELLAEGKLDERLLVSTSEESRSTAKN